MRLGYFVYTCAVRTGGPVNDSLEGIVTGPPGLLPPLQSGVYAFTRDTEQRWVFDAAGVPALGDIAPLIGPGRWVLAMDQLVPLSRCIYADAGTLVALADQNGSIGAPFSTITAALAKAVTLPAGPVSIIAAAGTYAEAITLPSRDGLAIIGDSTNTTIIDSGAVAPALYWAPTAAAGATIKSFVMRDLTIKTSASPGIFFESSTSFPNTFLIDGATFVRVNVEVPAGTIAARFKLCGNIYAVDCGWATSIALGGAGNEQTEVENCTTFLATRSRIGIADLKYERNGGLAGPGTGRSRYALATGTNVETAVRLRGQPIFTSDRDTNIRGKAGTVTIEGIGLTRFNAGGVHYAPIIICESDVGIPDVAGSGSVVLPFPDLDPLDPLALAACIFDRAQILGPFTLSVAGADGVGATRLVAASACQANFLPNPATGLPNPITIGPKVDFTMRDSRYFQTPGALVAVGSGTIDRDLITFGPVAVAAGPNALTWVPAQPPLPAFAATYFPTVTSVGAVGLTFAAAAAPPPGPAGLTILSSGAGFVSVQIQRI